MPGNDNEDLTVHGIEQGFDLSISLVKQGSTKVQLQPHSLHQHPVACRPEQRTNGRWSMASSMAALVGLLDRHRPRANFYPNHPSFVLERVQSILLELLDAIDLAINPLQSHCADGHQHRREGKQQDSLPGIEDLENRVRIPITVVRHLGESRGLQGKV